MPNYWDIPDAPWIRDAEINGMPEDPEDEWEYWSTCGKPIPYHVLARLNGSPSCLVDDTDWRREEDD